MSCIAQGLKIVKYLSVKGGVEITPFFVKDVHRRQFNRRNHTRYGPASSVRTPHRKQ